MTAEIMAVKLRDCELVGTRKEPRVKGNGNFDAGAFGILIVAAKLKAKAIEQMRLRIFACLFDLPRQ